MVGLFSFVFPRKVVKLSVVVVVSRKGVTAMNAVCSQNTMDVACFCPACGELLTSPVEGSSFAVTCPSCRRLPWCHVIRQKQSLRILISPEIVPQIEDIDRFASLYLQPDWDGSVICDLGALDTVPSLLWARLLVLNKRVRCAQHRLVLCWKSSVVREEFFTLNLNRVFEFEDEPT